MFHYENQPTDWQELVLIVSLSLLWICLSSDLGLNSELVLVANWSK